MKNTSLYIPEMEETVLELSQLLYKLDGQVSVDCLNIFRHVMVRFTVGIISPIQQLTGLPKADIVMTSAFGVAHYGAVKRWDPKVEDPLCNAIHDRPRPSILQRVLPGWAWKLALRYLYPNSRWQQILKSDAILAGVRNFLCVAFLILIFRAPTFRFCANKLTKLGISLAQERSNLMILTKPLYWPGFCKLTYLPEISWPRQWRTRTLSFGLRFNSTE
jgi:hypothetical protein